jgi:hypothetical protein
MLFDSMDDAYIEHLQQRGDTETPTFNIDDYGDLTPQERTEILLAMQAALLTDQADLEQAALEAEAERELRLEAAAIQSSVCQPPFSCIQKDCKLSDQNNFNRWTIKISSTTMIRNIH